MSQIFDVIIIGGGIAGLTVLHELSKKGVDTLLLESKENFGGLVSTTNDQGYLLETGPNAFLKSYKNTFNLVRDIGLENEIIYNESSAYHRYIYKRNKIHALPENPIDFIKSPLLSFSSKLRLCFEPFACRGKIEESIKDFGYRRFGKEVTDTILDAMIKGICTGDISKLEINSMFPKLKNIEKEYRSLLLFLLKFKKDNVKKTKDGNKALFASLKNGMGSMALKIVDLYIDKVKNSSKVLNILKDKDDKFILETKDTIYRCKKLVIATSAFDAKKILNPLYPDISETLNNIPYADVATITLSFNKNDIKHSLNGFGFLAPSNENLNVLGALFSSTLFLGRAPDSEKMIKVYAGGPTAENIFAYSKQELVKLAISQLKEPLQISNDPCFSNVKKIYNAIPLYNLGHHNTISTLLNQLKGKKKLFLTGNYFKGISVDAAIKRSKKISTLLS